MKKIDHFWGTRLHGHQKNSKTPSVRFVLTVSDRTSLGLSKNVKKQELHRFEKKIFENWENCLKKIDHFSGAWLYDHQKNSKTPSVCSFMIASIQVCLEL